MHLAIFGVVVGGGALDRADAEFYRYEDRSGVIGGRVMKARRVVLSQMEVGPVRRANQEAVIVRQSAGMFGDGLLGMSFLGGLKYTIDFNTGTINWIL